MDSLYIGDTMKKILIIALLLLLPRVCFAQGFPPLGIQDEGGAISRPVTIFNCVGTGIACAFSVNKATLTLSDVFLLNNGDVGTGVYDFGGATSFEIVNGTSPTVNASGEIAVDTTNNQLLYGVGSDVFTLSATKSISFTIESLAAADDNFGIWIPEEDVTLHSAKGLCQGTCTAEADVTLSIYTGGSTVNVTGTIDTEDLATGDAYTTLSGTVNISAGDILQFSVTGTPNPETDRYTFGIKYIEQRK